MPRGRRDSLRPRPSARWVRRTRRSTASESESLGESAFTAMQLATILGQNHVKLVPDVSLGGERGGGSLADVLIARMLTGTGEEDERRREGEGERRHRADRTDRCDGREARVGGPAGAGRRERALPWPFACPLLALCLPFACPLLALCLPFACPLLALCLPFACPLLALCLPFACPLLALCLPFACPLLALCLPFACPLLALCLPFACPLLALCLRGRHFLSRRRRSRPVGPLGIGPRRRGSLRPPGGPQASTLSVGLGHRPGTT